MKSNRKSIPKASGSSRNPPSSTGKPAVRDIASALKLVQGAVSGDDLVPVLTHFLIKDGRVTGYNGRIAISTPIAIDRNFVASPKASPLVRAVGNADGPVTLSLDDGRLFFASGAFRVFVDTVPAEEFALPTLGAQRVPLPPSFRQSLERLRPFISTDASRNWACGILFQGQCAYATNNVIAVECWIGSEFPESFNLPDVAVVELLRIPATPDSLAMTDNGITFYYTDGTWLHTSRYATSWPDMSELMEKLHATGSNWTTLPPGFFDCVRQLKPFVDKVGIVYISEGVISTSDNPDKSGASVTVGGLDGVKAMFNVDHLLKLEGCSGVLDFSCFPSPVPFIHDDQTLRGAIVGMRF